MFNRFKEKCLYENMAIVITNFICLFLKSSTSFQNTNRSTRVILFYNLKNNTSMKISKSSNICRLSIARLKLSFKRNYLS